MVAMSPRLWLVRHGATDWSDAGRLTGWRDIPLNDERRRQAQLLRRRLRSTEFDGTWSIDLSRAMERARLDVGAARCHRGIDAVRAHRVFASAGRAFVLELHTPRGGP
jgi:broad specificity phosphatase PhoE